MQDNNMYSPELKLNLINRFNNNLHNCLAGLDKLAWWKLLPVGIILAIILNILSSAIVGYFSDAELKATGLEDLSPLALFLTVVFAGPLIETLIFQFGVIEILRFFIPKYNLIALAMSAVLFALSHSYSSAYIVFTIVPGLLLAAIYLIFKRRRQFPFLMVFAVHGCMNLYTFIHNLIF